MSEHTEKTLQDRASALDAQILQGDILSAVDAFFHPDVRTWDATEEDALTGKQAKIDQLKSFFAGIQAVNTIDLHAAAVNGDVSLSEFTFDLKTEDGGRILWNEVIRRRWKDGLVIDERYYIAD